MELGIFSKTFVRSTLDETLAAVASHGLRSVQFNVSAVGLEPLPEHVPADVSARIRDRMAAHGIRIDALSGTFNMAHPDRSTREAGLRRFAALAEAAPRMGASVVTLCTGTRNRDNMWHGHPDNDTASAWTDLVETMTGALVVAERFDLSLAIEPEPGNVVRDAAAGRRLLDELGSDRLMVIFDPANVLASDRQRSPEMVLEEALEVLGDRIILGHGKDLSERGMPCAPGQGIVPWGWCVDRLEAMGFQGPMILHGFDEREVPAAIAYLRQFVG